MSSSRRPSADAPPSRMTILARGFTRKCPRCGSGHLFSRYFTIARQCPRCGLVFEREPGYWAGALAINIASCSAVFAVVFVALVGLTIPDMPVVPLLAVLVPIMAFGPIVWYPFSKTLWMAIDEAFLQRLDP